MRSLQVTKFMPWPPDSGGKRRSLAMARQLATLGEVVTCAFGTQQHSADHLATEGIRLRCTPLRRNVAQLATGLLHARNLSGARFYDRQLHALVRETAATFHPDVLVIEYTQLAPYANGVSASWRVLDMHNVESELTASYTKTLGVARRGLYAAEACALRRTERRILAGFNTVVVVSERDRERLVALAPGAQPLVCPNGWDAGSPLPAAPDPTVIFVALLSWRPNVDAARWLVSGVWPHVRRRRPDARLLLVGRSPTPAVQALAAPDIEVTGTVPDVRPYYACAQVAVAPLRSGGGSRLKILEALDAGRPLVSTSIGVEGLEDLIDEGVLVADDERSFADQVVRLLGDAQLAAELGRMGNAAVQRRHTWAASLAPLTQRLAPSPGADST